MGAASAHQASACWEIRNADSDRACCKLASCCGCVASLETQFIEVSGLGHAIVRSRADLGQSLHGETPLNRRRVPRLVSSATRRSRYELISDVVKTCRLSVGFCTTRPCQRRCTYVRRSWLSRVRTLSAVSQSDDAESNGVASATAAG